MQGGKSMIVLPQLIEMSKTIEKRYEMIQAHVKFDKKVRDIVKEYGVAIGTYYHWYHRYENEGIIGLVGKKKGPKIPPNKTPIEQEIEIIKIAAANKDLDAIDIFYVVSVMHGFGGSVWTVERILKKHELNRKRGRRSKKEIEKKRGIVQTLKQ